MLTDRQAGILAAVRSGANYAYGIAKSLQSTSSLVTSRLHYLERVGLLSSKLWFKNGSKRPRRVYTLTSDGQMELHGWQRDARTVA